MFSHADKKPATQREQQPGLARDAAATAPAQAELAQALNASARVVSQRRLADVLNHGPRAALQAKLIQAASSPAPLGAAMDGQGLTDEEELLQTRPALQREGMADDEELLQPRSAVQRQPMSDEEDLLQPKAAVQREGMSEEDDLLQPKAAVQREGVSDEEDLLQPKAAMQRRENTTGMPDDLKAGIEQLSGVAADDVHVQYNSPKPAQYQALAITQGRDIHVAPGQERHLPHEAWHAVQQMQGRVQPTAQLGDVAINDDAGLEREADVMGARALATGATATRSDD